MKPFYIQVGDSSYQAWTGSLNFAEFFRGKSGWWIVLDKAFGRCSTLKEIEQKLERACEFITRRDKK